MSFTRDLVSEPPNVLYPAEYAQRVKKLESLGLEVEIIGEAEMMKLGMGSLLAVGQGSVRDSQLVVIKWNGAADKSPSRSPSSARASASTPAASPSSPPRTWKT